MNDVQQKVAIVTGASQGIGAGLVAAFRQHGYAVVANSRSIADSRDPKLLAIAGDIIGSVCEGKTYGVVSGTSAAVSRLTIRVA